MGDPSELTLLAANLFRGQGKEEAARRLDMVWLRTLGGTDEFASDTEEEFVELAGLLGADRAVGLLVERFGQARIKSAATPKPGAPRTEVTDSVLAGLVEATREAKGLDVTGACRFIKQSDAHKGVHLRGRKRRHLKSIASIRAVYYRCLSYHKRTDPDLVAKGFHSRGFLKQWRESGLPYGAWLTRFLANWRKLYEEDEAREERAVSGT